MNILKSVLACVAVATFSFTAMAATPKGEVKDAKTTETVAAPSETKAKTVNTYYVTGQSEDQSQYLLSDSPAPGCGSGSFPCQIQTTETLTSPVDKAEVDDNSDVDIITHRSSL